MIYFVTAGRADEMAVIRDLQPPRLLISYWYFRNKYLREWVDSLGYRPQILLDSGAWSAHNAGAVISLAGYASFIEGSRDLIDEYINLDVIGDSEATAENQKRLERVGLQPMPVFHYGEDMRHLQELASQYTRVALGGTVPIKNKAVVAAWVREIVERFPGVRFHVLGTSSKKVMSVVPDGWTADSSTWIMMSANGKPKSLPGKTIEAKRERMKYWMREDM